MLLKKRKPTEFSTMSGLRPIGETWSRKPLTAMFKNNKL